MRAAHIDSYYTASAQPFPPLPPLTDTLDCDVAVIGAGITGLSTALHLAERGYRVVVLEAARVGWGASGRNGGQICPGYACDISTLEAQLGLEDARRLWALSVEATDLTRTLVQRHAIDCDLKPGLLYAALKPRQYTALRAWQQLLAERYDYSATALWDRDQLRERIDSPRYIGGLYDTGGGHLHPLNYTLGLARAALQAGVQIFEDSPALTITPGAQPVVQTAQGQVRCRHLALCGNAYLGHLAPAIRSRIMPVGTYIIATEPLGERANTLIRNDMAVADINFVLDYFRLSADRRLLFGGLVSYSTLPPPDLKAALRRRLLRVFPQLADVTITHAWGGFVAITINRAPHFGRLADNIYFAHGYSGHGLALTGLAGKLLAESIAGTAERFDVFTRIQHAPFPGGRLLRTPLLVLAMAYFRLRDLL